MIPSDVFKKIRRIQITTNRLVTDVFAGQYHSVFKGRGMEFDEVREYQPGDDIRTIDWNVTARTGTAHVKKYIEERELTVMIMVDASMSCRFGSARQLKSKLAAEIAAVLAFSAIRNNDKVGLIIFTDQIEKFIPPRKGTQNVLRVIREVLYFEPKSQKTDISQAVEYLSRVSTRKTVTFLISDFLDSVPHGSVLDQMNPSYKKALTITNRRHDLVAVTLNDPREQNLPSCGLVLLEDAELTGTMLIDTSHAGFRVAFYKNAAERLENRRRFFRSIGVDQIDIDTDKPYADELIKFFLKRKRRR